MHEAFDTRLESHKRAELCDASDRASYRCADVVFIGDLLPRTLDEIACGEGDLPRLAIHLLDHHSHALTNRHHIGRIFNAFP